MKFDQNQVMGTGAGIDKPQGHTEPAAAPPTEESGSGSGSKTKTIVSIAALSILAVIGLLLVFFNMRRIFIDQKAKEPANAPTAAVGETMGDLPNAVDPGAAEESKAAEESQVPETGVSGSNAEESQVPESGAGESEVSASELANENESLRAELEGAISDKELANQELQNAKTLLGQ